MKTASGLLLFLLQALPLYAQANAIKIPMTPDRWEAEPGRVEFVTHKSVPAMRVQGGSRDELFARPAQVVLKDLVFANGTIEFDVEFTDYFLAMIYFRREDAQNADIFYLRTYRVDDPTGPDAVQYTALTKGVALWDLHPRYQGPAVLKQGDWNHIKLVVSGQQMQVYVNDEDRPALVIPELAGQASRGMLAFEGGGIFANLVITPDDTSGVPSAAGFDPARHDPRYVGTWQVSRPVPLPPGQELVSAVENGIYSDHLPGEGTAWDRIEAERDGLINLSRRFGKSENRRVVWLKQTLRATSDQVRRMNLGFSDEVWVLLNGRLVHVDKNLYSHPIMKDPFGQISTDDASFSLPLTTGENEVFIGVANSFFGWAIMARLDSVDGITINEP